MEYKIGITVYDEWNLLYETKVGLDDKKQTLLYSVWGKTEEKSIEAAINLVKNLQKIN